MTDAQSRAREAWRAVQVDQLTGRPPKSIEIIRTAIEAAVGEEQQKLRELRGFTVGLIQGFDCTDPESAVPALRELLDRFDAAIRKGADDG